MRLEKGERRARETKGRGHVTLWAARFSLETHAQGQGLYPVQFHTFQEEKR